jgi:REP element-mobilizing transposase RayT
LPATVLARWREELATLPDDAAANERRKRIEAALDQGHGSSMLLNPAVAELVERSFLYADGLRYRLHAWMIMPNHVHLLATPLGDWTLSAILKAWKSYTAREANTLLRRKGTFWAPDYFDRAIRDDAHYANTLAYIAANPVKARLCKAPEDWRFSSSWKGR